MDPTTDIDPDAAPPYLAWASAGLILLVGGGAVIGSRSLGYWTPLGPGPGFFPFWLGALLIVLAAGWFVSDLRSWRGARAGELGPATEEMEEAPAYSLPTVTAIVISLCVLAALLEVLGYQLSMLLFLLYHLLVLGRRGLLLSVTLAAVGSFGVFVAFTQLLSVPLPASSIPLLRNLGL